MEKDDGRGRQEPGVSALRSTKLGKLMRILTVTLTKTSGRTIAFSSRLACLRTNRVAQC